MTRALRFAAIGVLLASSGCSYDSPEMGPVVVNICNMTMECVSGECVSGMCITQKADAPLRIALEVKPLRQPDGSDPLPIIIPPFSVDMPIEKTFALPELKQLQGFVRSLSATDYSVPIEADITFTAVDTIRGIESKVITVGSTPTRGSADPDFTVRLLDGRKYRMAIRPRDATLPPYYEMVTGGRQDASVEYPFELPTRTVVVKGATSGRSLRVRALSVETAEPISSTATLDSKGMGTLRFLEAPETFNVEIRAENPYTSTGSPPLVAQDKICDSNTPPYPVFTANSADLTAADGSLQVELPKLPPHIMFEGTVQLCGAGLEAGKTPDSLAISLHTADLFPENEVLAAAFEASTTANYNADKQGLDFCVQLIPGQSYDLLATPGSMVPCGLLNEPMRTIAARAGEITPAPVGLTLPEAAYLSAKLRTMEGTPVRGAAIDAIALGRGPVPYNRSRPAASDVDGSFKLQVDLGTYDVVIKPASGSGLPWQVRHDVKIGKADEFPTTFDIQPPVTVEVSLTRASRADASLKDAGVAAYAMVEDDDGERAVPIGSATVDAQGRFTLLLPPSIQCGWLTPC